MERITKNKNLICAILAIFFVIIITVIFMRPAKEEPEPAPVNQTNVLVIVFEPINVNSDIQDKVKTSALPDIIEHDNLNPRNMIIPQKINEDFDILKPCGYTQEQLEQAMQSESYKKMLPYVDTIMEAEKEYGVNALYLLCKLGFESGWGKHMAAKNNIGGWKNIYGEFKDFKSVENCIMYIAENLSTIFKDDVGTRLEDVCERYCPEEGYLEMLMEIMEECEQRIE